ncbi:MAG: alpha/beta hydrolase, partial [Candidatus Latescibacteria bacterium]|nr:alpha/beta hydrolase [Candidatus Latescibacterota bacterium]
HLPPRELATGAAVLVCPGGGYHHLAIQKEGHQVAAWLNTLGVAAYVLKYRLDRDEALQDAQEAMKLIRKRAEEWGLNSDQVGAMGFSAGGHLVVNLMINNNSASRPDFLVPIYVSLKNLDMEKMTSENAVPAFIAGASDDKTTPPAQAITLYQKLLSYDVPLELHLYEKGGHGFGLAKTKGAASSWTVRCEDWMRGHGLLDVGE